MYLLSYSGRPTSDDEQLFSSVARNLVVLGNFSADQLYGNLRLLGSYHGVEPGFPILVSLWYRLFQFSGFGSIQILYILPILFTSFSAGYLVILAIQFGYSERTGVISGLLFGLSSIAWPYAKTLFRETLISFLLLGGWILLNHLRTLKPEQKTQKFFLSLIFLSTLLLLALTKALMVVVIFGFLYQLWMHHDFSHKKNILCGLGFLGLLGCLWFLVSLSSSDLDTYYRYTGGFLRDVVYGRLINSAHTGFVEAMLAPLISPWKGLFWYSPVCLFALSPLLNPKFYRAKLITLPLLVLGGLLFAQAIIYDREWWTPTWGSRFLLPVIPLLIVMAFPLIHDLLEKKKYLLIWIVFIAGFLFQLPAVIYNSAEYSVILSEGLGVEYPKQVVWNISLTPIISQWQLAGVSSPELLLWRIAGRVPEIERLFAIYLFLYLLFSLVVASQAYDLPGMNPKKIYGFAATAMLGLLVLTGFMLKIGRIDPVYFGDEFKPVCKYLREHIIGKDILVLESYPSPLWNYLMNNECGQKIWYSLPLSSEIELGASASELADDLFAMKINSDDEVWLVNQPQLNAFSPAIITSSFKKYEHVSDHYFSELKVNIGHYVPEHP